MTTKQQEVYKHAQRLFQQHPDWLTFFRDVLGYEGVIHRAFSRPEEVEQFEKTAEYEKIQAMLSQLRQRSEALAKQKEDMKVITVRLPESLHEALKSEAHRLRVSMNKLCISKLLQVLDEMEGEPSAGDSGEDELKKRFEEDR